MSITRIWTALKRWSEEHQRTRDLAQFTCADCARVGQCGRPPSADCVEKFEQVFGDDNWRYRAAARLRGKHPYE